MVVRSKSLLGYRLVTWRAIVVPILFALFSTVADAQFVPSRSTRPRHSSSTWFEGWFIRITAENGADVVGLIVGAFYDLSDSRDLRSAGLRLPVNSSHGVRSSHRRLYDSIDLSQTSTGDQSSSLPIEMPLANPSGDMTIVANDFQYSRRSVGYVAILKRITTTGKLEVHECFTPQFRVNSARNRPKHRKEAEKFAAFEWHADGIGRANERQIDIAIPGKASLHAIFFDREPWSYHSSRGPEGVLENLRILRSHWSVYSTASSTKFEYVSPTEKLEGRGIAHQESNWGESFPKAYAWAQASTSDGRAQVILGGGILPVGGADIEGWLLGIRTPSHRWDLKSHWPNVHFQTQIAASDGSLRMVARSTCRKVEIELKANRETFSKLATPTPQGFDYQSVQSSSADLVLRAYRMGIGGKATLSESLVIPNAALEFGGGYYSEFWGDLFK
jgi:hypothetical protein